VSIETASGRYVPKKRRPRRIEEYGRAAAYGDLTLPAARSSPIFKSYCIEKVPMMHRNGDGEAPKADRVERLSDAAAQRLLASATEREAAWTTPNGRNVWEAGVPVAQLREAAIEAGISPAAFDAALADLHTARPPHRGRRMWRAVAAVAAFMAILVGGITSVRRAGGRVTPAQVAPDARRLAGAPACAPAGVPVERLRDLARRLHPETFGAAERHSGAVVGLLFDAQCTLMANAVTQRVDDELPADATLARLFPNAYHGASVSGIAEAEGVGPSAGGTWIVWGVSSQQ
jgi:hypothetical protein